MKRLTGIICMIFLYMMAGTLTVYAEDRSVEGGAGITFEGAYPEETKKEESTGGGKSGYTKTSLPQTGQDMGMLLPAAGCAVLILGCWWSVARYRGFDCREENVSVSELFQDYNTL